MEQYYADYEELVGDNDDDDEEADFEQIFDYQQLIDALTACATPSLNQIVSYVLILVGMSAVCRLFWYALRLISSKQRLESLQHTAAMLCGFLTIYAILEYDFIILVLFAILSYILMLTLAYYPRVRLSYTMAVLLISVHFLYEIFGSAPETWQRLRGTQMIAMMKTISLAYDIEMATTKNKGMPGMLPYLGYIFCPATCVLGPWISYSDYVYSLRMQNKFTLRNTLRCLLNICLAIAFLLVSNCFVPLVLDHPNINYWTWMRAYRDALAVRNSHYFICFLSQASLLAAGQSLSDANDSMVVRPWQIEWPRSVPMLVRNWNIPMHMWLKKYIYKPWQTNGNYLTSLLGTYLVSALLHGLHIRIYLVLLSLAIIGYVEYLLRHKLANIFDACISANPCERQACKYKNCASRMNYNSFNRWLIAIVNFVFSLLAMVHLAFLGIMMDSSTADGNLTTIDGLWQKCVDLNFLSYWLAGATYAFYLLI